MKVQFKNIVIDIDTERHTAVIEGKHYSLMLQLYVERRNMAKPFLSFVDSSGSYVISGLDAINDIKTCDGNKEAWRTYLSKLLMHHINNAI